MKELVIDRSKWDRGEKFKEERVRENIDENVQLKHRQDGRMCCLGFYLEACGVPSESLEDESNPAGVFNDPHRSVPAEAAWLVVSGDIVHRYSDTEDCEKLMEINDNESTPEYIREDQIKQIFAKHDVAVRFEGE